MATRFSSRYFSISTIYFEVGVEPGEGWVFSIVDVFTIYSH